MFDKQETEFYEAVSFLRKKPEKEISGDSLWLNVSTNQLSFILCDGVSQSASDTESSNLVIETVKKAIHKKRSFKNKTNKVIKELSDLNKKMCTKNLSSTFCMFLGSQKENLIATSGDSVLLIRDSNKNLVFYNNVYNLKNSSEGVFGVPDGREYILLNCIGVSNFRFELAFDFELGKGFEILSFSDGLLEYVQTLEGAFKVAEQIAGQDFSVLDQKANSDDISLIYVKIK